MRAVRGDSGLNGILLIDKPQGMTSHDVVDFLRRLTGEKRIGHAGTLDPMATGLLIMMVGKATKFSDRLMADRKTYEATVTFGSATDTDDAEGQAIRNCAVSDELFNEEFAVRTLDGLIGIHQQIPPHYSAIKVKGQKSYKAARKGSSVDLKPRTIEIFDTRLLSFNTQTHSWSFEVTCSKGTYIRSLARDLGEALGTCAHLSALRRTCSGSLSIDDAVTLEKLAETVTQPHLLSRYFPTYENTTPSIPDAHLVIGVFDGMHRGHQALIKSCGAAAKRDDVPAVMMTFDTSPSRIIARDKGSSQLYPLAQRIECAHEAGIDQVIALPFTHEFSQLSPEDFIRRELMTRVQPRGVWVGSDFRFGHEGVGDTDTLAALGKQYGFATQVQELTVDSSSGSADENVEKSQEKISSTAIREALSRGEVQCAAQLLGRRYTIQGRVQSSRGIGRTQGFPTANITDPESYRLIADGVYKATVTLEDGRFYDAAVFVGIPSNSTDGMRVMEVHLLDFEQDIVGETISVAFLDRLNDVLHAPSRENLHEIISHNVAEIASSLEPSS